VTQVIQSQRVAARFQGERRIELVRELFRRLRTGGARRAEARPAPPRDIGGRSALRP
jgi:hypothetical protein